MLQVFSQKVLGKYSFFSGAILDLGLLSIPNHLQMITQRKNLLGYSEIK